MTTESPRATTVPNTPFVSQTLCELMMAAPHADLLSLQSFRYHEISLTPPVQVPTMKRHTAVTLTSFRDVLALDPNESADCDIARVNLLFAVGLPGSECLDVPACLAKIDRWTEEVRWQTDRNFATFKPTEPRHTPGFIRCYTLCKLLRHCKGLRHHLTPKDARPDVAYTITGEEAGGGSFGSYRSSEPIFIHGLLGKNKIGSCSSFPVLFAAVGRRLGYPIKLVASVAHLFIRWDDPADTFNMDFSEFHINIHPDEYYIDKHKRWTKEEKECGAFLRPLTPVEEVAVCCGLRAGVLTANDRFDEGLELFDTARSLFPSDPLYRKAAQRIEWIRHRRFMEAQGWSYWRDDGHTWKEQRELSLERLPPR